MSDQVVPEGVELPRPVEAGDYDAGWQPMELSYVRSEEARDEQGR